VFEDASPELVRDFFWDDEFRLTWDDMLIHAKTLQECALTGAMMVHWVRKVSFFYSLSNATERSAQVVCC